jgi:hypothetical protein
MAGLRFTETEIAIRICPKHVRWPQPGSSIAWTRAHACVDALHALVHSLDGACAEVEQSRDLSPGAIARRRSELCDQALRKLATFAAFEIAEKALSENIVVLDRLSDRNPEHVQMVQKLTQALRDMREGIEATRRMVLDRCKMREGLSV